MNGRRIETERVTKRYRRITVLHPADAGLSVGVGVLGVALAVNALLGPLAFEVIEYRYGESMINQAIGLDAVALGVAFPLAVAAGLLIRRRHPAGPVLAFAPALFAAYMMPQYVIGPDYLGLPGNNEDAALFHIAVFVLAVAVSVGAWRAIDPARLRPSSRRSDRRRMWVMVGVAAFIALGRQLPAIAGVITDPTTNEAFQDNPTAFWLVAFLDVGVVTPVALVAAVGLRRGATWSRTAAYAVIGWFSLVPVSVAAMNVVMRVNDDPLVTTADTVLFTAAAVVFTAGAVALYAPMFRGVPTAPNGYAPVMATETPTPSDTDRPIHDRFADALTSFEERGDHDALLALYADECEVGNIVTGERHRGRDGAAEFWRSYRDQFDRIESTFSVVAGDEDGAVLEWRSTGSANGDDVDYRGATVLEYGDGAIVRSMAYYDPRAVGRQLVDTADVRDVPGTS